MCTFVQCCRDNSSRGYHMVKAKSSPILQISHLLLNSVSEEMADGTTDSGVTQKPEGGGVEGPEAMYVKLIASDGHEFIMKRDHALTSGTIKAMLSGPGINMLLK